ncbi:hypothetical protein [Paraflavitalea speifideaquila]|uniref:hypothetical protein n=1 Tax=Paraflavitalea speifideaquila TaxID=3076558 RepID=UPI0028EDDB62|nr:hypothetical protein [Paraflavitalea speifideiaquila]
MIGHYFTKFDPNSEGKSRFDQLLDVLMQLLAYTNGDINEALNWMSQLDKEYELTDNEYGMGDFIEDLREKGYIQENPVNGQISITSRTEQGIRKKSLEEIFGKLKRPNRASTIPLNQARAMRSVPIQGPTSLRYPGTDRLYHLHPQCTDQPWY